MAPIEFVPYALSVNAGTLAISPMPGRTRHYYADWQRLSAWAPKLVVSMTEQAELERKGAGSLGRDLRNEGIGWIHLPVADFGIPVEFDWAPLRDRVLAVLARGDRVLVHCFGGCGRSGMLVLRLMIAAGEDPESALKRLRKMRPCAIETEAQMMWAWQG